MKKPINKNKLKAYNNKNAIVALIKQGKTRNEIAKTLNLNVGTVSKHANSCGMKLLNKNQIGTTFTEDEKSVIIGSLLGDGHIDKVTSTSHSSRLAFKHSILQLDYMKYKMKLMGIPLEKYYEKSTSGLKFKGRVSTGKIYTCVSTRTPANGSFNRYRNAWYINDDKQVPKLNLTPLALAIWFMDDGTTTPYQCYFCTNSFSTESCNILVEALLKLGLNARIRKNSRKEPLIYLNADSILKFIGIVTPFMCTSMMYKIYKLKKWRIYCELTGTPLELNTLNNCSDAIMAESN